MDKPFLSIIIPAHNEEHRLPHTLETLFAYLDAQPYSSEVWVVENGSQDRTLQLAQELSRRYRRLYVLHEEERGKGLAVRRGMLAARGEYRMMCDADLSMPPYEIGRFLPPQLSGVDIAIASREAPGAKRYHEPLLRHWIGRAFNLLIRLLVLPQFHDTQCGFKCFTAAAAERLFPLQTITGWTFDVEILYLATRLKMRIQEVPIQWYFNPESKVHIGRDSIRMALDLLYIRSHWRSFPGAKKDFGK
ncbi:MAG: glycosyltransferase family 2 protein [Anaerolineales bacterium]|nr:glycosyltransferase family 2 protein [Anaerolineales bacterium]MCS7248279.1 glycosyltransferase family 2 protein [Anaerolineales bacterium]MDW8162093.1 glycosyltransferase family 2 protein [Anaerolineales bacterium]MDW8447418.1 glycosyltransferase family 2 protein [Anaerolineales bacterium]